MGLIPQRFRVYRGSPVAEQLKYFGMLERHFKSDVVDVLKQVDPLLAALAPANMILGEVKDFSSLVTPAQEQGVPISTVEAGTPQQRSEAKAVFDSIAKKIIERSRAK